ncbi:MAG: TasA family protein [Peptostreptococcaceae bacterium]
MSRLIRLKDEKRKNRIKVASCGLALALAMGSAQGLGTYALFTDNEDISSDLAISTGDVDVEIDKERFEYTDVQPNTELKHEFKITNYGTLNQNVNLALVAPTEVIPEKIYNCISSYSVEFVTGEQDNPGIVPIENLKSRTYPLEVNDGSGDLFILKPGQSITAIVTITVGMTEAQQQELQGNSLDLRLNIESTQIDKNNIVDKGFFDVEQQSNILTIGEANILYSGEALKVTDASILGGTKTFTIDYYGNHKYMGLIQIIDKLDGELNATNATITEYSKSGAFENSTITIGIQGNKALQAKPVDSDLIKIYDEYGKGNYIDIKLDYGNDIANIYRIDFKGKGKEGNRLAEAKIILLGKPIDKELEYIDVVDPPKEEVEKPTEPEVVEPPMEEIEKPSEPGVVEPSKEEVEEPTEPEVVEPPKEEIIEIPKQPEAIEPPKENEGIQE